MSSPNRPVAGGIDDAEPIGFLDSPDYDEAFGPRNFAHKHKTILKPWGNKWMTQRNKGKE